MNQPLPRPLTAADKLRQTLRVGREADAFLAAMGQQVEHYRELAELAGEQGRLVSSGDTEGLLALLGRRERCTLAAAALEEQLASTKHDWAAATASWPADRRATAERLLSEARALLAQITARDEQDALLLQQRKLDVGRRLRENEVDGRLSRRINGRYAAAAYAPTPSLDTKR